MMPGVVDRLQRRQGATDRGIGGPGQSIQRIRAEADIGLLELGFHAHDGSNSSPPGVSSSVTRPGTDRCFHGHVLSRPTVPVESLAGNLVRGQHHPHGRMALAQDSHKVGIGSRNTLCQALANLGNGPAGLVSADLAAVDVQHLAGNKGR
jgi:hypothetical protein